MYTCRASDPEGLSHSRGEHSSCHANTHAGLPYTEGRPTRPHAYSPTLLPSYSPALLTSSPFYLFTFLPSHVYTGERLLEEGKRVGHFALLTSGKIAISRRTTWGASPRLQSPVRAPLSHPPPPSAARFFFFTDTSPTDILI